MANVDIKSIDHRLNGVNSDTNLPLQMAFKIDVVADGFTGAADVLKIADLPKGYAVKSVTLVVTTAFTSEGSATGQVKLSDGTNTAALGSATAKASLGAGATIVYTGTGSGGFAYKADSSLELQYVNATAAFTAGAGILVVELLPIDAMLNKG